MANWTEVENKLALILSDSYYRQKHAITSPTGSAQAFVRRAQGDALPAFSGEITVVELKHPGSHDRPSKLIRGCDSTREDSLFGGWWIDSALFDRFRSATSGLPAGQREAKIKAFMRARSAVSEDWSNIAAIAELRLPLDSRTPALVGKAHYQRLVTDPKHPDYVPNVFLMGGDLQFYICIRERGWIKPMPVIA
jgi:hypothetical protein